MDKVGAFPAKQDVTSVAPDRPLRDRMAVTPDAVAGAPQRRRPSICLLAFTADSKRLWAPTYKTGDISIHGPYTPYLTTC